MAKQKKDRSLLRDFAKTLVGQNGSITERTLIVDFDEERWQQLEAGDRRFVYDGIKASDYPCPYRGKKRITVDLYEVDHDVLDQEIVDRAKGNGDIMPVRPIVEVFGEEFPDEQQKSPVIGICGEPVRRRGELYSPYVFLYSNGVDFYFCWIWPEYRWRRYCRFLVVRKVEDL